MAADGAVLEPIGWAVGRGGLNARAWADAAVRRKSVFFRKASAYL